MKVLAEPRRYQGFKAQDMACAQSKVSACTSLARAVSPLAMGLLLLRLLSQTRLGTYKADEEPATNADPPRSEGGEIVTAR